MKKFKKNLIVILAVVLLPMVLLSVNSCGRNKVPQLGKDPVRKVVAAMTLEEKSYFVVGTGMRMGMGAGGFGTLITPGEGLPAMDMPAGPPQPSATPSEAMPSERTRILPQTEGETQADPAIRDAATNPRQRPTEGVPQAQTTAPDGAPPTRTIPPEGAAQTQQFPRGEAPSSTAAPDAPAQPAGTGQGAGRQGGGQGMGGQLDPAAREAMRQAMQEGGVIPPEITAARAGASVAQVDTSMPESVVIGDERVPGAAGSTYAIPRLGIPSIVLADGPAGLRISPTRENDDMSYYATAFPIATLLASTWDTDLIYRVGEAMGSEVLEYGTDIILAPGVNIQRNPLNGRNFEYYSEDPYLSGKMASAFIRGVQSQGVGTSIKHFAANNAETNRMSLNTIVSERALREIYLESFRIAVTEAQPWTVMSSYNKINGIYTSENSELLNTVLRDDWGFQGFVMTDWGGGEDPVKQMIAGNDLLMPGNVTHAQAIIAAVNDGIMDEKILDRNVERILNVILNSPAFKEYSSSNKPDLNSNAQVARQAATDGMVLLRNENSTLPFSSEINNIAAFGNTSYNIITGGTGSGDVNEAYSVSLTEGLENAGYVLNTVLRDRYTTYIENSGQGEARRPGVGGGMFGRQQSVSEMTVNSDLASNIAANSDIAIITIGRNSGEGRDRSAVEGDFLLSGQEVALIKTVTDAFHARSKKVVVILNIGGVIETESWKNIPDAILLAWQGGQETGNSITDILSGKVNPSGKLTATFPLKYEDNPSSKTFPGKVMETDSAVNQQNAAAFSFGGGSPAEVVYDDGIYVGYRYFETFGLLTSFEFGFGLSYTNFEYGEPEISSTIFKDKVSVTFNVTNTGNIPGREIVQLYLTAPARQLEKPERELKRFKKTALLQPGESETITFDLEARSLASFETRRSAWVAEPGSYQIKIGSSSRDIRHDVDFRLEQEMVVETVNKALAPVNAIVEMSKR